MGDRAFRDAKYAKLEVRDTYDGHWKTDLTSAIGEAPLFCCGALWCSWCVSYSLRKRALHDDMTRYICCNGDWPCSGRCGEQKAPQFCLCMEVTCCFPQSVASTRWMLQDEQGIRNTKCDNCIIGTMIAAQYLACLCSIAACISGSQELATLANLTDLIADILWCSVCACMQTQHKVQLDLRDANPGVVRPHHQPYRPPQGQAMGHPPPPHPGYGAPPPGYGQPPPQYYAAPPPQYAAQPPGAYPPPGSYAAAAGGYPPQAYPPPPKV